MRQNSQYQITIFGFLTFLTILSPALLHTNQFEFIIQRFDLGFLDTSYFDSILYISYLIFGVATALLSNKLGERRNFVILGSLGSAFCYYLMTTTLDFSTLLIYRFLQGGFTVLCWQTLMTLVLDYSDSTNRGKNMGIFGIFLASAMGVGPVLGGILAETAIFAPYYSASILSLVVLLITIFLLQEPTQIKSKPTIMDNIAIVWKKPQLISPGIFNFVDRLHIGFILFILPLLLQSELNVNPSLRGMVLGLFALPFILLQYPIGRWSDKNGRYKPIIIGSIFNGVILSIMGFLTPYGLVVIIFSFILLGIGNGFAGPPAMALVGDLVEDDENAIGMGFFNLLGNLGIITGPLLGGFLVDNTNFVFAFIVAGLIEIISLAIIILLLYFVFNNTFSKQVTAIDT
jgi:MFS family permease